MRSLTGFLLLIGSKPTLRDLLPYKLHNPTFTFSIMDVNNNGVNDNTELRARGNWNEIKGAAKQKWGNLTDDDMTYAEGKQDEWFGNLQEKTGHAIDDIKSWFHNTFSSDVDNNTAANQNNTNQNRS